MRKYTSKSLADIAEAAGSMLLFTLFAACMLIIIGAAASVYTRISSAYEQSFTSSASLKYVTNKLRSADSAEILGGGEGIAVVNGGITSVIYSGADGIYEMNISSGETPEMSGGTCIFGAAELSVTEDGSLYTVSVTYDNEENRVLVRKG
ncbi:MAG: hypothetical protein ACI4KM_12850 [Oscillospiraceae bacterium]